jgi:hypothetical protein
MQPKYRCWLFYNVINAASFSLIIPIRAVQFTLVEVTNRPTQAPPSGFNENCASWLEQQYSDLVIKRN